MEPISTTALAGSVATFLIKTCAGNRIGKWLSDRDQKRAFEQALSDALSVLREGGLKYSGYGVLDESFLSSPTASEHIWSVLLDPGVDREIDYQTLGGELESIYKEFKAKPKHLEQIEYFVDCLIDQMWHHSSLRELLTGRVIRQHDIKLTLSKKKKLVYDYLSKPNRKGDILAKAQSVSLSPATSYVEPLLEVEKDEGDTGAAPHPLTEELNSSTELCCPGVDFNGYMVEGTEPRLVVVAESGYGKTTLLRELFLRMANNFVWSRPIPVFWGPREAESCAKNNIRDLVVQDFQQSDFRQTQVKTFVDEEFDRGNFVFLIDALDQMAFDSKIIGCLESQAFRENRVILTTRPRTYADEKGHLSEFKRISIRPFNKDQRIKYLDRDRFQQLTAMIDNEFLEVPLLLNLVNKYWPDKSPYQDAPRNRTELYDRVLNSILDRQENRDATRRGNRNLKLSFALRSELRRFAYLSLVLRHLGQVPHEEVDEIMGDQWLLRFESMGGIVDLLESGRHISFRHRSFQEYLAAEFLRDVIEKCATLPEQLRTYLYHPYWEESLRFLAGMLGPIEAELLAEWIMSPPAGSALVDYMDNLRVAALCLGERPEVETGLREVIVKGCRAKIRSGCLIEKSIKILASLHCELATNALAHLIHDSESSARISAARALAARHAPSAVETLVTLLDDECEEVKFHALIALSDISTPEAVSAIQARLAKGSLQLDIPFVRGFCDGLTKLDIDGVSPDAFRLLNGMKNFFGVWILGSMKTRESTTALLELLKSDDDLLVVSAALALSEVTDCRKEEPLLSQLQSADPLLRQAAISGLGKNYSGRAVPHILKCFQDQSADVRREAIDALVPTLSTAVVPALVGCLKDENAAVRRAAARALGHSWDPGIVADLEECLLDINRDVKLEAVKAIARIGSPGAVALLAKHLQDADEDVRRAVVVALGATSSPEAFLHIRGALEDKSESVRQAATRALSETEVDETITPLIELLHTDDVATIEMVASLLARKGSTEATRVISELLCRQNAAIRVSAIEALQGIATPQATQALIDSLGDSDRNARRAAADALRHRKAKEALAPLIRSLGDADSGVRWVAIVALGEFGSAQAVIPLIARLRDKHVAVRTVAAIALGEIADPRASAPLMELLGEKQVGPVGAAATALGRLGEKTAAAALTKLLHHPEEYVVWRATMALGELAAVEAAPDIMQLLQASDDDTVEVAIRALSKYDSEEVLQQLRDCLEHRNWRSHRASLLRIIEAIDRRIREQQSVLPLEP